MIGDKHKVCLVEGAVFMTSLMFAGKICPQYSYVERNCNATHDTECECDTDYFWNKDTGSCRKCEFCPLGYGSRKKCSGEKNTVCVRCQPVIMCSYTTL